MTQLPAIRDINIVDAIHLVLAELDRYIEVEEVSVNRSSIFTYGINGTMYMMAHIQPDDTLDTIMTWLLADCECGCCDDKLRQTRGVWYKAFFNLVRGGSVIEPFRISRNKEKDKSRG